MRQYRDSPPIVPVGLHRIKVNGLLLLALYIIVLSLKQADIHLSEIICQVQPEHLRVAHTRVFLGEIGAVGVLILFAAAEDIVNARRQGHFTR